MWSSVTLSDLEMRDGWVNICHYDPTVSRRMTEIELVRGGKKHVFRWHHDAVSRGRGQNV